MSKIHRILNYEITFDSKISATLAVGTVLVASLMLVGIGYWLADKYFFDYDTRNALEYKIESASENSHHQTDQTELALAYYLNGDVTEAKALLEEELKKKPDNSAANGYYGMILADQKLFEQALVHLEKALKNNPLKENLVYIYLGISYYETFNYQKAVDALEKGVQLERGSSLGNYYLGLSYKKLNMSEKAKSAFKKALELSGGNYPAAKKELNEL